MDFVATEQSGQWVPTRRSLIDRLRRSNCEADWQTFFDTYWRLIYGTARKGGLSDQECEEVVQETVVSVFKQLPEFEYEPAKGSFKSWLFQLTQWRILDQLRKRKRQQRLVDNLGDEEINSIPDTAAQEITAHWEAEWENNLLRTGLDRLKTRVDPKHYQIFFLSELQGWDGAKVAKWLGVTRSQVYTVSHRLRQQLMEIVDKLKSSPETPLGSYEEK